MSTTTGQGTEAGLTPVKFSRLSKRGVLLGLSGSATMNRVEQSTSIDVAASPERVWEVLADVEKWPEWTDSVTSVKRLDDGQLVVPQRPDFHVSSTIRSRPH